ncbi:unnamed protein product [Callosobruchus maculatus]|uniref:SWIM-type domain-containing protein n=2 Tax=Callosobruchus maculatus TaxID=64391 RepID=A0A653CLI5_CALMS|nr:unnamed protein product [Callosobruchus maculatus]
MASKHVLRFSVIVNFFKEEEKLISRGENAVESGHVTDMIFDSQLLVLRGNVHASMRDRIYKVELKLDADKEIMDATCTCPRGQYMCHHMAALAIFGYQNISVTDVSCQWSKKKPVGDNVKTIKELFPKVKDHRSVADAIPDSKVDEFKQKLSIYKNAVGFCWLLKDDPKVVDEILDVESLVFAEDYLKAQDKEAYLIDKLKMDQHKIENVALKTTGQAENDMWLVARKNRLTSSNFGAILAAVNRNKYPPSLFKKLTESYTLDGIKAIQWGKQHESSGISLLEAEENLKVQKSGLWLDTCGFLGGSPDGLVNEDAIVEVKCPYKLRESKSLAEDLKDKTYIIYFDENDIIQLNENHLYYHQIQGNLWLTKRKFCYLVIWTPQESLIYSIAANKDWEKNVNILKTFYLNVYIPFLCGNKEV